MSASKSSKLSKLPKQAIPIQRLSTSVAAVGQFGGVEASGIIDILEDYLSKP